MNRARAIAGGSAGNLVEWFDWYVYAAFSLYFADRFFPGGDPAAQFIKTSGIFWAGFTMRPVGGWLLGRIADRRGRRAALAWSVGLMGGGSLLLAAIPDYRAIGVGAPVLLLAARLIQGLSLGGEYGAAATYLAEVAEPHRRGFWSSFQYVTLYGGQLLALGLLLAMQAAGVSDAAMGAWGWRLAFVASALLATVVFWIRRGIAETPAFTAEAPADRAQASVAALWREQRRSVLIAFALAVGSNIAFYTVTTYMQKYLVVATGLPKGEASRTCAVAIAVAMLLQPPLGALSDRIGRKPLLYAFGIGMIVAILPCMAAIAQAGSGLSALPPLLLLTLILSCATATSAAVKTELFPVHLRALGVGLPYAVSQSLFGGSAEAFALSLRQAGHERVYFLYVMLAAGVALAATLAMRESAPRRRR